MPSRQQTIFERKSLKISIFHPRQPGKHEFKWIRKCICAYTFEDESIVPQHTHNKKYVSGNLANERGTAVDKTDPRKTIVTITKVKTTGEKVIP